MPKYILLINTDAAKTADVTADEGRPSTSDYAACTQAMLDSGAFVAGDPLEGIDTAKSVSPRAAWSPTGRSPT